MSIKAKSIQSTNRITYAAAALLIGSASALAHAGLVDGRTQVGGWNFDNGHALDIIGHNNGEIEGRRTRIGTFDGRSAASFRGRSRDYIEFNDSSDYQLTDGVLAIEFQQTGRWNSMETLFSKDARGFKNGGHLSVNLLRGQNRHEGSIQVRLQSDRESYTVNSGTLSLNQWYGLEFGFGSDGMQLAVNGVVVDTNAYTGGLIGNTEDFSLGASRWSSRTDEWDHMRNGFSGYISSVGIYSGAAIPSPGALALLITGGLISTRRKR